MQQWLIAEGWAKDDVFLDLHGIGAGARWKEALAKANERCEAVLFLVSPHSLASTECYVELRMAEDMGKAIMPVILPARVPEDTLTVEDERLAIHRDRQIVDASLQPREAHFTVSHSGQERTISFHAPTLTRVKARLEQLGISPDSFAWSPGNLDSATPYPGLAGFSQGEAALFFGRAGDIARGFADLRKSRRKALHGGQGEIIVIQAASGAGKSSYLKAGLWPRLVRDPDFTAIAILRPATGILTGDSGIGRQFAAFFAQHGLARRAVDIHGALRAQPAEALRSLSALIDEASALGTAKQRLANPDAPPPTPIIAIDQAEELFAAEDAEESNRFLAIIAGLLAPSEYDKPRLATPPILLWTIRADSMDALLHAASSHGLRAPELFPLPPISRTSYTEIIEAPLAVANSVGMRVSIDPILTQELIAQADGADALPLLAYTLRQLVEDNRSGSRAKLTLESFNASGGMGGALSRRLKAAQKRAGMDEAAVRKLFVPHLATWDADATPPSAKRIVAYETDLLTNERRGLRPLADALVEERLLCRSGDASGDTTLEVAHETLLRRKPISDWLQQEKDALQLRDQVLKEARNWVAGERDQSLLTRRGLQLDEALELASAPNYATSMRPAESYLAACRSNERKQVSKLRKLIIAAPLVGWLFLFLAILYQSLDSSWLINAKREAMRTQGKIIAAAIAGNAMVRNGEIRVDPDRLPAAKESLIPFRSDGFASLQLSIQPERVAPIFRRLTEPDGTRARIYDRNGDLVVDSSDLLASGDIIAQQTERTATTNTKNLWTRLQYRLIGQKVQVYREIGNANGQYYPEVRRALKGEDTAMLLLNERSEQIVSVAIPITRLKNVIGVLLLSTRPGEIDNVLAEARSYLWPIAYVSLAISLLVAFSINALVLRIFSIARKPDQNSGMRGFIDRLFNKILERI